MVLLGFFSMRRAIFVAATGQNVGKTTVCLGLISSLKKRVSSVGFLKPVGQEQIEVEEGAHVDKDVPLIKAHFGLPDPYEEMSPLLLPSHFTRDYLDGKISVDSLKEKILAAFQAIQQRHTVTVIEGTGHMGVGSIIDLNNAQVAALLGAPILLVAPGGLGSTFDELALNYSQCEKMRVPILGIVLNRVWEEKKEMIDTYMKKALKRWNLPLLGSIPYSPFLSAPTLFDFEQLFHTKLLTQAAKGMSHFHHIRLAASSVETYRSEILPKQLIITPASREEIILATLSKVWEYKIAEKGKDLDLAMILTGKPAPSDKIIEDIEKAGIPMLYVPLSSSLIMKMIHSFTAKIRKGDSEKIEEAIQTVEKHLDLDRLLLCRS